MHKNTIAVTVAGGNNGELRFFGEIVNTPEAINKLATQFGKAGAVLSFCYEAGSCGYNIHRQLRQLLRHGKRFSGRCNWTKAHYRWMEALTFEQPTQFIVMQEYIEIVASLNRRAAPQLMADLGLIPSEHSSGAKQARGGITKTGIMNTSSRHVRRLLVEAAWTYRHPARKSNVIQRRAECTPQAVQDIAWKAQIRLCSRNRRLEARGKLKVQVSTAIARELAGFVLSIGQVTPDPIVNA